ncbi:hypothetical protein [Prevotella sp. P3-122]|uniref:hypothetical protein n=1 Tax=Prevotella sp. P3-122 TaxID=2024223 RepID=UPI000B977A33|nr:hypothetical protein [Prevotella sp. P3-122]OYP63669.1 hypothetical protein CIL02_01150 [Prevotella sp. P3-122]
MKKELFGYILMLLAVCIIIGCTAEIDASAASSSSANLAVLLEYCLGALSLLLVLAIRIVGITFFSLGIIEMINDQYTFVIPPIVFMIIGTLIIFIGYRSKPYEPLVRIGKLKRIPCEKTDKKKHILQIALEWAVGVSASLFASWLLQ